MKIDVNDFADLYFKPYAVSQALEIFTNKSTQEVNSVMQFNGYIAEGDSAYAYYSYNGRAFKVCVPRDTYIKVIRPNLW